MEKRELKFNMSKSKLMANGNASKEKVQSRKRLCGMGLGVNET